MPAGDLYSREIRSSESPEDLHRRVVVQISPLLAPAKYKLAAQDPQNVQYSRHYLPTAGIGAGLLTLALGCVAIVAGASALLALASVPIACAILPISRRRELLTVSIQPRPGGSTAFLSGYLSARARMLLIDFAPPTGSRSVLGVGHGRLAARVPEHPSAG